MSQNSLVLPTTGTVSGLAMTQATNNALDTLNTLASGGSAPSSPEAGQLWHDTTNNLIKIRSLDNTTWIPFLNLSEAAFAAAPYASPGGTNDRLNRIINGAMNIDQVNEGASYSIPVNNIQTYTLDQWFTYCNTSGSPSGVTIQRVSDAPAGFANSLKVTVGTGAGSVGVNDYFFLSQPIEGNNIADLAYGTSNALPTSLSFWVKSSITGTFAANLQNSTQGRSIVFKFTIASAGVWQQVLIPNIPGDQLGTYTSGSGLALLLNITIAAGSTYQNSTLGSWLAADWLASTTQTNSVLTTSGATFQVTGVQLNSGPFNQPFDKKLIAQDLQSCQRYYEKTFLQGTAVAQNAGIGTGEIFILSNNTAAAVNFYQWQYAVRKRTSATVTTYNPGAANANWRDSTTSADKTVGMLGSTDWYAGVYVNATTAVSDNLRIHATANARM